MLQSKNYELERDIESKSARSDLLKRARLTIKPASVVTKDRFIVVIVEANKERPTGHNQNNRKEYEPEHQFA